MKSRANRALNNLNLKPTCDTIEREWKISKFIAGFQLNFHLRQISLQKKYLDIAVKKYVDIEIEWIKKRHQCFFNVIVPCRSSLLVIYDHQVDPYRVNIIGN